MTLNLWGTNGDWPSRRPVLRDGLCTAAADVIAFQESIVTARYDQVDDLLPPGYHLIHQDGRSPDGTGCSIASRLPLGEMNQASLHVTSRLEPDHGWIGSVAAVHVEAPQPMGAFLFVHLKPSWQSGYDRERELQSAGAARFIERVSAGRSSPVILAGDLDAPPEAASIRFWTGRSRDHGIGLDYIDAWEATHPDDEGHTFTPRNPLVRAGGWAGEAGRRIDYILFRGVDVAGCSLAFDGPVDEVWPSDHFGVIADFRSL